ncbi:hypothetical protein N6H14_00715 [Paenibacillus sp. CC-CFT747]|nr:hypothetical protein N6H14_00715 [Paenibacillus sp. CC-CFT747]
MKEIQSYATLPGNLRAEQTAAFYAQEANRRGVEERHLAKDRSALLTVIPSVDPDGKEAEQLVKELRKLDAGGLKALVTGGRPTGWTCLTGSTGAPRMSSAS